MSVQRLQETLDQSGAQSLDSLDGRQISQIAKRAGAGAVLVGSIIQAGSGMRIDAQLEDLATGRVLLAESVVGTDLFAMVDQLSARIRAGIGFGGATNVRGVADVSTASLEAYRLYSQAATRESTADITTRNGCSTRPLRSTRTLRMPISSSPP